MTDEDIKETTKYELCYFISPELREGEVLSFNQDIEKLIIESEGQMENKFSPKKQNLAYPIKHHRDGYFGVMNFIFPVQNIEKLSGALRLNDKIIRFLIIKPEVSHRPIKKKKRAVLKPAAVEEKSYKKKIELEELDKKLEEILGKEEL